MKFGTIAVADAHQAIVAHSLQITGKKFKKGHILNAADIDQLHAAGVEHIIAAQLETGDVDEDTAAQTLADAVCGSNVEVTAAFTGRCNVFATQSGVLVIDEDQLDLINLIHEDLTIATLEPYIVVESRQMVATIKIIPFAVARSDLDQCLATARQAQALIRIAPFQRQRIGLIQTLLPGLKDSVLDKTVRVLQNRLAALSGHITEERRCAHTEAELSSTIQELLSAQAELILIAGASAIVDRRDVIPAAIVNSGGRIEHFGMPVDPGNLLLLGYHGQTPVIGLPGCARSPKYNGLDKVLVRLMANLELSARDVMLMGAGGLLKETTSRGAPRTATAPSQLDKAPARAARIVALVLAAGQSRRMGERNKLLVEIDGQAMVAHTLSAVVAAQVESVVLVTGHEHERVKQTLSGFNLRFAHNPVYAEGISTSLRVGLAALPADYDGVLVCLGDMPRVTTEHINRLIAAFDPLEGRAICVPTCGGKRGNPILWAKRFVAEMQEVAGDVGAKHLLGEHDDVVYELELNDRGVLLDIDSPQALAQL